MRPCHDQHPNPTETADSCRLCYLYLHDASYRVLFESFAGTGKARSTAPCRYLGEPLLGIERDRLGLDHAREWRYCEHPELPLGPVVCGCSGCGVKCGGYTQDRREFTGPELIAGLRDPLEGPTDQDGYLAALKELASTELPDADTSAGDGIITVGGGLYWPMIVVQLRMLRETGCTLPVEIWHRSSESVRPEDIEGMGARLINADTVGAVPPKGGWECKLHALAHTRFRRVLFLDADAYCVADPTAMIEGGGFQFWQDLPHSANAVNWDKVGINGQHIPPVQGGQLIVDRSDPQVWRLVVLAHWMCRHSEWYFRHGYGDQDTWRIALAVTGYCYRNLGEAPWDRKAFVCQFKGKPLIVHRCQGKLGSVLQIPRGQTSWNSPQPGLPKEDRVFHHLSEVLKCENNPKEIFESIYERSLWGDRSGPGSSPQESEPFIQIINTMIRVGNWQSLVDVGCGDGRVGKGIQIERYIGVDVVRSVILNNQIEQPAREWIFADISNPDVLPAADVLLVKDVLHHWPNSLIREWLSKVLKMDRWRWLVLCQDREQHTEDCHLGGYRGLDPSKMPLADFGPFIRIDYTHKAILTLTAVNKFANSSGSGSGVSSRIFEAKKSSTKPP